MGNQSNSTHGTDPTLHARVIENQRDIAIYQDAQGEQFQKYTVLFDGSSNFESSYQFRVNNHHSQLVDVLFAASPQSYLGCVQPGSFQVVTQRIPYRLTHFPPQNAQNALTLLQASLKGFKDLFKVHGLMIVKDSMIGVNSKNKVKVWLNPNFAVNRPQSLPISLQKLQVRCHEREIVHNIFDLISSKTQHGTMWREFTNLFESKNIHTFDASLSLIQQYTTQKRIKLDGYLRNPFNKPGFDKKSEIYTLNSEIDKLEDIKLTNINQINNLELKTVSQNVPDSHHFHELKTNPKIPHFTQISSLKSQPQRIIRLNPQWKPTQLQPIRQPERVVVVKSPPKEAIKVINVNTYRILVHPPFEHHRRNQLISQTPLVNNNIVRQSQSQSKKFDIKFNYNQKPPSITSVPMTKSINLLGVRINQFAPPLSHPQNNSPRTVNIKLQPNNLSTKVMQQTTLQAPVQITQKQPVYQTKPLQLVNLAVSPQQPLEKNESKVEVQEVKLKDSQKMNQPQAKDEKMTIQKGLQAKSVLSENQPVVRKPNETISNVNYLFDTNQVVNSSREEPSQKGEMKGQIFQQPSYQIKLNEMSRSSIGDLINEQDFHKVLKSDQTTFPNDKFNKVKEAVSLPNQESQHTIQRESFVLEKTKFQAKENRNNLEVNNQNLKEIIKEVNKQVIDNNNLGEQNQPKTVENESSKRQEVGIVSLGGKLPNLSYRDIRRMLQETLERT